MYCVTWQQYCLWILKYKSAHCFFRGEPWVLHRKLFGWPKLWIEFRTHSRRPLCPSFQSFHFLLRLLWFGWKFSDSCWCSYAQASADGQILRKKLPGAYSYNDSNCGSRQSKRPGRPGNVTFDWTQDCPLGDLAEKEQAQRMDGCFSWQIKILASCSVNWLQWFSLTSLIWVDDLGREPSDLKIGKETGQDTFVRFKLEVRGSHLSLVGGACAFKDFMLEHGS